MKNNHELLPQCSVDYAFQRIGGKYKGRILWHLYSHTSRYGELRKDISGITHKMLTQALRELEQDGLIIRQAFAELPPRVEYSLTPSGKGLIPFIASLSDWAREQMKVHGIPMQPHSPKTSYCVESRKNEREEAKVERSLSVY